MRRRRSSYSKVTIHHIHHALTVRNRNPSLAPGIHPDEIALHGRIRISSCLELVLSQLRVGEVPILPAKEDRGGAPIGELATVTVRGGAGGWCAGQLEVSLVVHRHVLPTLHYRRYYS
jgi:hypothetical protein